MQNTRMLSGATWVEKRLQPTGQGHGLAGCTQVWPHAWPSSWELFLSRTRMGKVTGGVIRHSWVSHMLFHQAPVTVKAGG